MLEQLLLYVHTMSLALWFGGLFGYVLIVWPAIAAVEAPAFPRTLYATIGTRTAPWIYLAMGGTIGSFLLYWVLGYFNGAALIPLLYLAVLVALVANNVVGSTRTWPMIMLAPDDKARTIWGGFRVRMAVSLALGLSCLSLTILYW